MTTYEKKGDYVIMTPERSYTLNSYKESLREAEEYCRKYGLRKILADISMSQESIPVFDRFQLGIEMANVFGNKIKMAILAPPAMIDKLGENSAVNRGAQVFVTSSREQALEWLENE
jgi:hypothetical protein